MQNYTYTDKFKIKNPDLIAEIYIMYPAGQDGHTEPRYDLMINGERIEKVKHSVMAILFEKIEPKDSIKAIVKEAIQEATQEVVKEIAKEILEDKEVEKPKRGRPKK